MYPTYTCYFDDSVFTAQSIDDMVTQRKQLIDMLGRKHNDINVCLVCVDVVTIGVIMYVDSYCHIDKTYVVPIQSLPIN